MRIGLIPSFVGYFFMLRGLSEIMELSERFVKIMPYVKGMIFYSIFLYVLDLLGGYTVIDLHHINTTVWWIVLFVFIMMTILILLSAFISYNIIMGIKDIEAAKEQNLSTGNLYYVWKLLVGFTLFTHLVMLLGMPSLAVIGVLISFLFQLCYLYAFYKTKNLYERGMEC